MTNRPASTHRVSEAGRYEIRLDGHLDAHWTAWFDGLNVSQEAGGTTVISGPIADQAALHGVLQRIRDLGLPLLAVVRVEPDKAVNAAPHAIAGPSPSRPRRFDS
jgi:hypothetical protein